MKKILLLVVVFTLFAYSDLSAQFSMSQGTRKLATTMTLIERMFVVQVDDEKLADDAGFRPVRPGEPGGGAA